MFKCTCGNEEFIAHQVVHVDVVVDGSNHWLQNHPDDRFCCYESNPPFGPYVCKKCGKEYPELKEN